VFDGSACELNQNWKELHPERTVRSTIGAVGSEAGTASDPFNQNEAHALLNRMSNEVPNFDLTQFEQCARVFFLPSEAANTLIPKLPAGTPLFQV
jgi:hypothetical protein